MQFVRNGPDLPERLLQAHEDGGVVFFCGAGISYPARLPGFQGLVDELYKNLAITPNAVQQAAIKAKQFDTAISLLETDIVGGRETVRSALEVILRPDLDAPSATETHEALLTLGKSREGRMRLVTTNFDRLFEEVIETKKLTPVRFQAPLLPVPKNRWDGLVYLHGLLGVAPTTSDLDRLVLSSGDFGLAYLTERWAARFVSELFRNYTVCFVGYSINDPVLRYMMDALAADRLLGETPPEMFAFGSHSKGKREKLANEWQAKNVTPILYREHNRHAYLHRTLRAWAETYRDGVRGKERIVVECAIARPMASTQSDDFVGRLLWALSDSGGLPARRFAELDPVPPLAWLEPLCGARYRHPDLSRFGVPPQTAGDAKLVFSLTSRPSPYDLAPLMCIADAGARSTRWDEVMRQLARWMIRHLDDPTLLLWLAKSGGRLHGDMVRLIENRLSELSKIEREGRTAELDHIRSNAPMAIPRPLMKTLWRLLLTGRVKSGPQIFDLYDWRERFGRDGLTTTLRLNLRELLTPRISLREPFSRAPEGGQRREPERVSEIAEWEIVLSADHVHTNLADLSKCDRWMSALPELLIDVSSLLRDALDLMQELGGADSRSDRSYIHQPSISEHPQNKDFHDWTALIDLSRDAWLATAESSPEHAVLIAESWWKTPYPLFKRLGFFAAAQGDVIPLRRALDWLLADDHWWLWSIETEREAIRLLVALAIRLDTAMLLELEKAILAGPPREIYDGHIEPEKWARDVDSMVWLRLAKMAGAGAELSTAGAERFAELSAEYPQWELAEDQRDEFSFWMGDGGEWRSFSTSPRRRKDLTEWLKEHPDIDFWEDDDWRQRCRVNFSTTACALWDLANQDIWLESRWRQALQAWSEDQLLTRSWRYMAPVLVTAPEPVLNALAHSVSWWLRAISETFRGHEAHFIKLAQRVLALDFEDDVETHDVVGRAINHPIGHATEGLLRFWHRHSLEDEQGLPEGLKLIFTDICDTDYFRLRHGRVLLAAHLIPLFRVDSDWATENLLPLFDWTTSPEESRAVWRGFLLSPRLYRPLMDILKPAFLDTARHYDDLGDFGRQFAALLTFAALEPGDTFANVELAAATRSLPQQGLEETAKTIVRALEGAGDQRDEYWENRITPYLHKIWPKTRDKVSPAISEALGQLCVAARDAFPEALQLLHAWIQPPAHPDYLIHKLHESGLCQTFPERTLEFLGLVIGEQSQYPPGNLTDCLTAIRNRKPELQRDVRFERLLTYLRRHGQEIH